MATIGHPNIILLDIDGVLVTTPGWKRVEILEDGFSEFNSRAAKNLASIIASTSAAVILTTTHRKNYSLQQWKSIFLKRGIATDKLNNIDEYGDYSRCITRAEEIRRWINEYGDSADYVIIDDDTSLDTLPLDIKRHWVKTKPLIGLDDESRDRAMNILSNFVSA